MIKFQVTPFVCVLLSNICILVFSSVSWCPHDFVLQASRKFEQKTDRFWEFKEQTNSWVEVKLPYDLLSCQGDNCTKVGSIEQRQQEEKLENKDIVSEKQENLKDEDDDGVEENSDTVLPQRKRISLTRMSETSIWVTGESGSIYERFWNGLQWVIAPHDLPVSVGRAVSVFMVNQTILALSETGYLYQMQLTESSQQVWVGFIPAIDQSISQKSEQISAIQIKSAVVSHDGMSVYFCTKNGSLLELTDVEPPRWLNHGRPPGANVAVVADAANIRTEVAYTISSAGDLYEYDGNSKPSWKKHVWRKRTDEENTLLPSMGFTIHGLHGDNSISLFLLTKDGKLVERRLHHRKWQWIIHQSPGYHKLTSITPAVHDEYSENFFSLYFTTSAGSVIEYKIQKNSGAAQDNRLPESWVNHMHPQYAKAAKGIAGIQYQVGRILFPLDDGRLAELHISGLGGECSGPYQLSIRRKTSIKYIWSIIDAPETEGWNAEYCTEERGPTNCLTGIKDEPCESGVTRPITRRRKANHAQQDYLYPDKSDGSQALEEYRIPDNWINVNFRLRVMHGGASIFLVTDDGLTFEHLNTENVWLWLRHDHQTAMRGALGNYNGSLFFVDEYGSLLIRERSKNELAWVNCTAMRKGKKVIGGPPWDRIPGKSVKVTAEDALFFVGKNGRLLQFTVAVRKFKWKDVQSPPSTKIACIVDKELFRENIVFVVGRNGRLYQYNKLTELWHEHYQSQHLILSRLPGTAMRQSPESLTGSLFMLSEDGGLVEYHWNALDGWKWVEHGTPSKGVTFVGAPGPCFEGNQLFLIGSNGKVYLRYMDQLTWKWKNCGFPNMRNMKPGDQNQPKEANGNEDLCEDDDITTNLEKEWEPFNKPNIYCNPKVASTRPIPFAEDSVIFELRDGRLAEMRRIEESQWIWSRTIGTPTSSCISSYWAAFAP